MRSLSGSKNPGNRPAWRRFGRVPTLGLVLLCLSFLGGFVWLTINDQAMASAAAVRAPTATPQSRPLPKTDQENFVWCEPLTNTAKYQRL